MISEEISSKEDTFLICLLQAIEVSPSHSSKMHLTPIIGVVLGAKKVFLQHQKVYFGLFVIKTSKSDK